MRRRFTPGMFRQACAVAAMACLAVTATMAQDNRQSNGQERAGTNGDQAKQAESEQDDALVLKTIEFESISVTDFLSAARRAGIVDQTTGLANRQSLAVRQQRGDSQQQLYLAHKPDSSVLFVRGTEEKVKKVEDFANKLDVAPEERPEKLEMENGKQARRLPKSEISDTQQLLRSLGLSTSTSSFGETHYLVFEVSDENDVKQIEQVLETLQQDRDKKTKSKKDGDQQKKSGSQQKDDAQKQDQSGENASNDTAEKDASKSREQEDSSGNNTEDN